MMSVPRPESQLGAGGAWLDAERRQEPVARSRVAAIDCGTNSIRLLVADLSVVAGVAHLTDVHREMRMVRLGQGVDASGRLAPEALDRTWRALADYTAIIRASGATAVRMTATSATRDADNAAEFADMVLRTLGQAPEVIAGTEEAALSFRGAVGDLDAADGPFLVFDIGGGSTEFVVGSLTPADLAGAAAGPVHIAAATSENIGSVRITERLLIGDPPSTPEIAQAQRWVDDMVGAGLGRIPAAALDSVRTVVAVAGTATTMAAGILHLPVYDPPKIHLSRFSPAHLRAHSQELLAMSRAERAVLGYMHPGRVDVIGGGSLILATIVDQLAARIGITEVVVCEHDILDGIALSLG